MVGSEHGYVMLLTHPKFKQFTPNAIADAAKSAEVLVALSCENRGRVDDLVSKAVAAAARLIPNPRTTASCTDTAFRTSTAMFGRCSTWTRAPPSRVESRHAATSWQRLEELEMNASQQIDKQIAGLTDYADERWPHLRKLVDYADAKLKAFRQRRFEWSPTALVCRG